MRVSKALMIGMAMFALAGTRALASDVSADRTEVLRMMHGDTTVKAGKNSAKADPKTRDTGASADSCRRKDCCARK